MRCFAIALFFGSLASCTGASSSGGASAPVGPIGVTPAYLTEDGTLSPLADGGMVPLYVPPQGGHVLLIGAQITGLPVGTVSIRARLRDLMTNAILAEDTRTVVTRAVGDSDTLTETDPASMSQVANVAPCPNYASRDVDAVESLLEVTISYGDPPTSGTATRRITPSCPTEGSDAASCVCECSANYTLGKCPGSFGGG